VLCDSLVFLTLLPLNSDNVLPLSINRVSGHLSGSLFVGGGESDLGVDVHVSESTAW